MPCVLARGEALYRRAEKIISTTRAVILLNTHGEESVHIAFLDVVVFEVAFGLNSPHLPLGVLSD